MTFSQTPVTCTNRIDPIYQDPQESDPRLVLHYNDFTDSTNLIRIIK